MADHQSGDPCKKVGKAWRASPTVFGRRIVGKIDLFWCVVISLFLTVTVPLQGADGEGNAPLVREIYFFSDGPIRQISEESLLQLLTLKTGEPFTLSRAHHSIRRLYSTDLFFDVQIQDQPVGERSVDVRVDLIRRYLVRKIAFEGDVELGAREIRRELAFREGEPYSDTALEESISRLRNLYLRRGFFEIDIEPQFERNATSASLELTYRIQAGEQARVRSLELDLEGEVDPSELLSRMNTQEGGDYSEEQIESDIEQLRIYLASQGFFDTEIYLREGPDYSNLSLDVDLVLRVVTGPRTDIVFEEIELSSSERTGLPIFSRLNPGRLLIRETVAELKRSLQERGYFLAEVSADRDVESDRIVFRVDPGRRYDLKNILFEGNESFGAEDFRPLLRTRQSGLLGRGDFTDQTREDDIDAIRFFYEQRGYLDVEVGHRFEEADENLSLIYEIQEGPIYRVTSLEVVGNEEIGREELLEVITLREGNAYSPYRLAADRANVLATYENEGFRDVRFESQVRESGPHERAVTYLIEEGVQYRVEDIIFVGNVETKPSVVQREILLEPGDRLSYERLLQSETNLYDLAIFNRVRVKEIPAYREPAEKSVLFTMDEAKKYSLFYGLGYSHTFGRTSSEGLRGTFGISNSNFMGSARTLSLSLRAGSQRQRGTLSYTLPRPWGKDLPTILSFTVDNEERVREDDEAALISLRNRPYDAFRVGASTQTEKILSRRESLFFRYEFERVSLKVPQDLEEPLQFFREEEQLRLSSLSSSYLNESRDDPSDPTRGFFLSGEATLTGKVLGSEEEFFKILTQGRYYYPLFTDLTVVAALRVGVIAPFGDNPGAGRDNPVTISERFFSGGSRSLRGLPLDLAGPLLRDEDTGEVILVGPEDDRQPVPLGGNALIIGNLEFRFPLFGPVGGVLFYDVGNVFEKITQVGAGSFSNAVGLGATLGTPIGPVRLDAAYNPNPPDTVGFSKWNFHINIGHPF